MGWIKTMNREKILTKEEIMEFFAALIQELNLRLMIEQQGERILWVEDIVWTDL